MLETSARLLRLLSLLQTPREWSGPQLAERLSVSTRTVRADVERLRRLGYPVHATPGAAGGYRLGAGARMPPLILDDEEAVAVVLGLRTAAGSGVSGIEESSLRTLAKLEQILPSRLRGRVAALHDAVVTLDREEGPTVGAEDLARIAAACRDHERLRFAYRSHDGTESRRDVEPYRLVRTDQRWYLVGWDTARRDWRTFRVDRLLLGHPNGPRFTPREEPEGGAAARVVQGLAALRGRYRATVRLHAPIAEMAPMLKGENSTLEAAPGGGCLWRAGAASLRELAVILGMLDVDFEVVDPPELAEHVRALGRRYLDAAG